MVSNNTKPAIDLKPSINHITLKDGTRISSSVNCDIAAKLISEHNHYVYTVENKKTYVYFDGVYQGNGEFVIKRLLQDYYMSHTDPSGKSLVTTHTQDEIIRKVQIMNGKPMSVFQSTEPVFNVENGVLNLETLQLEPPSPDRYTLNRSSVVYDPNAECPEWLEFLDSALDKPHQPDVALDVVNDKRQEIKFSLSDIADMLQDSKKIIEFRLIDLIDSWAREQYKKSAR
jgi:hypothetical protein